MQLTNDVVVVPRRARATQVPLPVVAAVLVGSAAALLVGTSVLLLRLLGVA